MHSVPFGEYVPQEFALFFAGSLLADVGEFNPTRRAVFNPVEIPMGLSICYESIFGDEIRQYEGYGSRSAGNISDDGWYGDTSAAWEHLNMVRMRKIENHRWVLRD